MKIAVVTDSNSGITQAQAKEMGITVLPMPFMIDGETSTLITQTPYDDRRVIDKTFHITFIAFDVSLEILRELSE